MLIKKKKKIVIALWIEYFWRLNSCALKRRNSISSILMIYLFLVLFLSYFTSLSCIYLNSSVLKRKKFAKNVMSYVNNFLDPKTEFTIHFSIHSYIFPVFHTSKTPRHLDSALTLLNCYNWTEWTKLVEIEQKD